ncbi:MAG: DNA replication/repair protein RecF [Candidatus Saccharimonadales bacterium]
MMVQSIQLQHFRSYKNDSFEFGPSVNIIVGPNAIGKTNLLEAILVIARGSSYRVRDAELIEFDQPWARVDASVDGYQRTIKLVNGPKLEKTYELAGRAYKRLNFDDSLPVVMFEPNHLILLTGSPEGRREYLDTLLVQTTVSYNTSLRSFQRTLAQRNRLLKDARVNSEQLFPWNVRLSKLGGIVARGRVQLVDSINQKIGQLYKDLAHSKIKVSIEYNCSFNPEEYESHMLQQLEKRVHEDITLGFTSFGPHREDFSVIFDGHRAEKTASRGETRTFVVALKLIELELLKEMRNKTPFLLLDDVFSDLDGARRRALTLRLQPYQTFITTTDADIILEHFNEQSNVVLISKT